MAESVEVVCHDPIAPGTGERINIAVTCVVAVFNVDGSLFAIDDFCVRCGTSLADGTLIGTVVICPGCDWQYDVTTGYVNGITALRIDTFETKSDGSRVRIRIPAGGEPMPKTKTDGG